MKGMINSLNRIIDSNRNIPLLYMTDAEPSLLSKKISGLPDFKSAIAITKSEITFKQQIYKSVKKIIRIKICLGLIKI